MNENDVIVEHSDAILRSLYASFPILASVAAAWSEYKNIKQIAHIKEMLEEFAKRITSIENSVDKNFLGSDEMIVLIEQTINKGKDEIVREKRLCYSDFLKNSTTTVLSRDKEKGMILETISKLSISHIRLLAEVANSIKTNEKTLPESDETRPYCQIKNDKLTPHDSISEENVNVANVDYLLAIGVFEMPIHRGKIISYASRSFTLSNLGWRVIKYLQ